MSINQSIRMDEALHARLEAAAAAAVVSKNALMQRYIEEGLRMDRCPGIVFRTGPAGRRAGLAGGPDVWEVVRIVNASAARGEHALVEAADYLRLPVVQIRSAVAYYAAYRAEIDRWISEVDRAAADAERDWQAQREVLR